MPSLYQILLVLLEIACEVTRGVYTILCSVQEILERTSMSNVSLPEAVGNATSGCALGCLQSCVHPTQSQTPIRSARSKTDVPVSNQSPRKPITVPHMDLKAEQETTLSTDSQKSGTGSQKNGSEENLINLSPDETESKLEPIYAVPFDRLRSHAWTSPVHEVGIQNIPVENVDDNRQNQPTIPKSPPKTPKETPKSKISKKDFNRSISQAISAKDEKQSSFGKFLDKIPGKVVADARHACNQSSTREQMVPYRDVPNCYFQAMGLNISVTVTVTEKGI